jgi:hypothetical protein
MLGFARSATNPSGLFSTTQNNVAKAGSTAPSQPIATLIRMRVRMVPRSSFVRLAFPRVELFLQKRVICAPAAFRPAPGNLRIAPWVFCF